ncbi:MAG: CvpA family protein [Deltaproteobacteria bacterium]|nr:CvpA family protein [bacterium]MCB9477998.1 CvpA family protein [Deltaproteobacteria bacterium]MCB9478599.1 CvpA family protein [Deltaproteobacteria bacterium]MCB9488317.1 CvpA family protein [Deltaproteobacteria bacterium]
MPYVDLVILIVIGIFVVKGLFRGFFVEALTMAGWVVAFLFAGVLHKTLGDFLADIFRLSDSLGRFLAFGLVFMLITFGSAWVGHMLAKGAKRLNVGSVDRTLGAAFGVLKGLVLSGIVVSFIAKGNFSPSLAAGVKSSLLGNFAMQAFQMALDLIGMG